MVAAKLNSLPRLSALMASLQNDNISATIHARVGAVPHGMKGAYNMLQQHYPVCMGCHIFRAFAYQNARFRRCRYRATSVDLFTKRA